MKEEVNSDAFDNLYDKLLEHKILDSIFKLKNEVGKNKFCQDFFKIPYENRSTQL